MSLPLDLAIRSGVSEILDLVCVCNRSRRARSLLRYVLSWFESDIAVELATRVAVYLVRLHFATLTNSTRMRALVSRCVGAVGAVERQRSRCAARRLQANCERAVRAYNDEVAFNEAGLTFLQRALEEQNVRVFSDVNATLLQVRKKARASGAKSR